MGLVTNVLSVEQKRYSDIDMAFTMNPGNNDIFFKTNEEAVKQSVKNLLMTSPYDRPFNPLLSSQVNELLFEPWSPLTRSSMKKVIKDLLDNYEPRIKLTGLDISNEIDTNAISITLYFTIVNTNKEVTYSILLGRTR